MKQTKNPPQTFSSNLPRSWAILKTPNRQDKTAITQKQTVRKTMSTADTTNNLYLSWPSYSKDLVFDSKVYGITIKKNVGKKIGYHHSHTHNKQKTAHLFLFNKKKKAQVKPVPHWRHKMKKVTLTSFPSR